MPQGPAIILANEFFDALPIHQAERRPTGWHERAIAVNAGGELALTVLPEPLAGFEATLPPAVRTGAGRLDLRMAGGRFRRATSPARVAAGGAALVIDYGHATSAAGDTFQAVRSHRYASPLALPGLTDLTAHVDFEALARAARGGGARIHGPVEQGTLLKRLGIEARAAILQSERAAEGQARHRGGAATADRHRPADMGALFKAIGVSAPQVAELPGFAP